MKKSLLFFWTFFAIIFFIFSLTAFSQIAFHISPLELELKLSPGSKTQFSISFTNQTDQIRTFYTNVEPVYQDKMGQYNPLSRLMNDKEDTNTEFSCSKWIQYEEQDKNIVLNPKETKIIKATITIPPGTPIGDYAAIVVFDSAAKDEASGGVSEEVDSNIKLDVITGTIVFVEVTKSGILQTKSGKYGKIENFELRETKNGLEFAATLVNLGKRFIEAKGQLIISRDGEIVINAGLGGGRARVIPGQKIELISVSRPPFTPGNYLAKAIIDYGGFKKTESEISFSLGRDKLLQVMSFQDIIENQDETIFLTLNKDFIQTQIVPKSNRTLTVSLRNDSAQPILIKAVSNNISDVDSTHFRENIEVTPDNFEVLPYQSKNLKILVKAPSSISDGNKYIRIDFTPQEFGGKLVNEEMQEMFAANLFLILDNVKGEKTAMAKLEKIDITMEQKPEGSYPHFKVYYKNTGNIHIKPSLLLNIKRSPDENQEKTEDTIKRIDEGFTITSAISEDYVLPGMDGILEVSSKRSLEENFLYDLLTIIKDGENEIIKEESIFEFAE